MRSLLRGILYLFIIVIIGMLLFYMMRYWTIQQNKEYARHQQLLAQKRLSMTEDYQMVLTSRRSNRKLQFTLPHCLYLGAGKMPPSGTAQTTEINLRMNRFAFSSSDFKVDDKCVAEEKDTVEVKIRSMSDIYINSDTNPFTYKLTDEIDGANFIEEKDHVFLYKTGPRRHTFFYQDSFPNMTYPLSIEFVGEDTKNSQYKYYFRVHTIIHDEFQLFYNVVANYDNIFTDKYMDKFKRALENGENPLEQKEAIQAFMQNNEVVARYFEQHSTPINSNQ